ncbi:conserved hypothetical protein [Methanosalsum zhilinae DSM 4017]|uniref:Uncharacterized protein n=1 Tax=Methanosalsum zhilinae (strain DSM 4017 / NBRC 107636 / OCM 62 / WeN5) TaxID=679901 RepID=F7XKI2_METZD|nr:hypothetical protein [Methanosalsum zhilinae]AEH61756.1 conserved hypothetical protein [Methanosalsum zhilinae DSM 4017]
MEDSTGEEIIASSQSLSSLEMGRDDVNVVCTYGKISIWFGRQVPDIVIGKLLIGISNVDPSAVHEYEIICDFEKITEYESCGFVLVSYAKVENGYRATFNIPFSSKKALFYLAESISEKLKTKNVIVDLYWNGDDSDIVRLYDVLKNIDDWKIKQINYKDETRDNRSHHDIQF